MICSLRLCRFKFFECTWQQMCRDFEKTHLEKSNELAALKLDLGLATEKNDLWILFADKLEGEKNELIKEVSFLKEMVKVVKKRGRGRPRREGN